MARIGLVLAWFLSLFGRGYFQGHDHGQTARTSGQHINDVTSHVDWLAIGGNPVTHRPHQPISVGDTHIDRPGQHGNNSPFPVVHRTPGGGQGHPPHGTHSGETHIDRPGQHGNNSPFPVVHRTPGKDHGGHDPHGTHGGGETHIDRPGQHGNNSPYPVVHRTSGGGQGQGPHGTHGGETHIDRPGEHGNNTPFTVVHRGQGEGHGGHASHTGDAHVEGPGQTGHDSHLSGLHEHGSGDRGAPGGHLLSPSIAALRPNTDIRLSGLPRPLFLPVSSPYHPLGPAPLPPFRPPFVPPPGIQAPPPFGPFGPPFRRYPLPLGGFRPRPMRRLIRRRLRRLLRSRGLPDRGGIPGLLNTLLTGLVGR